MKNIGLVILIGAILSSCGERTTRTPGGECTLSKEGKVSTITCNGTTITVTDGESGSNGQDGVDGEDAHAPLFTQNPASSLACLNGGTELNMGTDLNDSGVLDSSEVTQTIYLCNGQDGNSGGNGHSCRGKGKRKWCHRD